MSTATSPLVILGSIDPVQRDRALVSLLADTPAAIAVQHDLDPRHPGRARRAVMTPTELLEREWVDLSGCPTCAVREDVVDCLARLTTRFPGCPVVIVPPVSAPTLPVARLLCREAETGGRLDGCRLAAVAAVCEVGTFERELLDDDLLSERDLHLTETDRRSVGEALAAQIGHADFVLSDAASNSVRGSALVDQVRAPDSHRLDRFPTRDLASVFDHTHHQLPAEQRIHPLSVREPTPAPGETGVWTLSLASDRPLHPGRLMDRLADLGLGRIHGRGHFWLATRPFTACAWEGVGGQLSMGSLGQWEGTPGTRLIFTGVGGNRQGIIDAFDAVQLTAAEAHSGPASWLDIPDGFAQWLGERGPLD